MNIGSDHGEIGQSAHNWRQKAVEAHTFILLQDVLWELPMTEQGKLWALTNGKMS